MNRFFRHFYGNPNPPSVSKGSAIPNVINGKTIDNVDKSAKMTYDFNFIDIILYNNVVYGVKLHYINQKNRFKPRKKNIFYLY